MRIGCLIAFHGSNEAQLASFTLNLHSVSLAVKQKTTSQVTNSFCDTTYKISFPCLTSYKSMEIVNLVWHSGWEIAWNFWLAGQNQPHSPLDTGSAALARTSCGSSPSGCAVPLGAAWSAREPSIETTILRAAWGMCSSPRRALSPSWSHPASFGESCSGIRPSARSRRSSDPDRLLRAETKHAISRDGEVAIGWLRCGWTPKRQLSPSEPTRQSVKTATEQLKSRWWMGECKYL